MKAREIWPELPSGPYLPMTEPVDWNCIPSALGLGSALSVSAGRLHFPLAGSWLVPLSAHPGVHPVLTSWWWIHNFREKMNFSSSEILCNIIMQTTKSSCTLTFFTFTGATQENSFLYCYLFSSVQSYNQTTYTEAAEWACLWSLRLLWFSIMLLL